ncbi:homoserine kinase [uncultured Jatrophihabitans sp.]|uniref:homoserine kinase n=1 Tax=uncultured Jatrophihabitans sp. TaxID=1610747 RepID=UPI0035CB8743
MLLDASVRVRVPATSANLGPGFDALGLALSLHDVVTARVIERGVQVEVRGEASAEVARDESHLVVATMRRTFDELAVPQPGLALDCANSIPHARGLGSSAAAIVAGVLLARALVADGRQRLPDADALSLAASIEGHPDNVAPCLLGGLTIAWGDAAGGFRAIRREVDPAVVPVALIAPFAASTVVARELLPATVPHADAAFTAGRAALLVAALTATPQALVDATQDRLHQTYREPAMPQAIALVEALRARDHAAVVSGAGPTVLVLARGQVEAESVVATAPTGWRAQLLSVDARGAVVESAAAGVTQP